MSDYVYQPYPGRRYHPVHGDRVVHSKAEDEALLAEGWVDSYTKLPSAATPAPAPQPVVAPAPEPDLPVVDPTPEPAPARAPEPSRSRARRRSRA